jgi:ADP-heptose:LPS heptosyltransferase
MWVAKYLESQGHIVSFDSGRISDLSESFGFTKLDIPRVDKVLSCGGDSVEYRDELTNTMPNVCRPVRWGLSHGLNIVPMRPVAKIPDDCKEEAAKILQFFKTTDKTCLIFPRALFRTRMWSTVKYSRLAYKLESHGISTLAMDTTDEILGLFPKYSHGHKLAVVAALIEMVDFVVGNDSGMSHLSGTLGTQTFAVCGPTDPQIVFGHDPNIIPIQAPRNVVPCVGCHFKRDRGFVAMCDYECEALQSLSVEEALNVIKTKCGTLFV